MVLVSDNLQLLIAVCWFVALLFGIEACGPWDRVPWRRMCMRQNSRYFGGGWAIARHVAFIGLWSVVAGAYSVSLVLLLTRLSGGQAGDMDGASIVLSGISVTSGLCWLTAHRMGEREERRALSRGKQNARSVALSLSLRHLPLLLEFTVKFLVPFYRPMWRRQGVMGSVSNTLLSIDYLEDELLSAAARCIREKVFPQVADLEETLAQSPNPGACAGVFCSTLYRVYGHEGARELLEVFRAAAADAKEDERRTSPRERINDEVRVACPVHGPFRVFWSEASADGAGRGVVVRESPCVHVCERAGRLTVDSNGSRSRGELRHKTRLWGDVWSLGLRIG